MTDRFSCAILFEMMERGRSPKSTKYFQEELMGTMKSIQGILHASATNSAKFKILKLKGGKLACGHILGEKKDYAGNSDDNNDVPSWVGEDGEQAFIKYQE